MLPGPLFAVELVGAGRRRRYFTLRVVYALLALVLLWSVYGSVSHSRWDAPAEGISLQQAARASSSFFIAFSWLQLLTILIVAPAMVVGTISTERERRTIEYLFATDLTNAEIVVGKTLARLLLIGKLLLVGFPILMLFRLLGGVPANLVVASMLIAGSTALVVASLSMCVSVWSARARDATVRVYAVLAALVLLPLGMYPLFSFAWAGSPAAATAERLWRALLDVNPLVVLTRSMSSGASLGLGLDLSLITTMASWHAALAGVGLLIATAAVRRVHLREATRGDSPRFLPPRLSLPQWKPPLGEHPMVWKELFAANVKTRLGFVGRVAIGLLVAWVLAFSGWVYWNALTRSGGLAQQEYLWTALTMIELVGCATLLLLSARAASQVAAERERDTWLSLVSTPLSGGEIVAGKLLGNLYAARWSLLLMLVVALPALTFDLSAILPLAGCLAVFALLATFVSLWGLTGSLKSPSTLRAMGIALGATLFLGGGYLTCCCPVIMGGGSGDEVMVGLAPCMPFLLWAPVGLYLENPNDGEYYYGVITLLLGVTGYAVASVTLARTLVARFDAWAGRTSNLPDAPEGAGAHQ